MAKLRLRIEYDGTDFAGWQLQPAGARTVQGTLQAALERVTGTRVTVHGAGRTDAGVHAAGQVAHVESATRLGPEALRRALNAVLPHDVAIRGLDRVPASFHARRDARGKLYRYRIWNAPEPSPLRRRTTLWVRGALDHGAIEEAAASLQGTHDFTSFRAAGSAVATSERTLRRIGLEREPCGVLALDFEGTGFLRHMVRNLVGTLLEVGTGRRPAASMGALLAARDRGQAGPTAPARGLVLVRVDYDFPTHSNGLEPEQG